MFHKEDMEAYKNIKAPRELKEKVLSANTNMKAFPYRQLYLAVASFAMIVSLSATWNWNQSIISIKGNEQMVSMASEARGVPTTSISIEIDSNHKRKVNVSEGLLFQANADGKQTVKVSSGEELLWKLDAEESKEYELSVTGWGRDKVYLLTYDQAITNWVIKEQ